MIFCVLFLLNVGSCLICVCSVMFLFKCGVWSAKPPPTWLSKISLNIHTLFENWNILGKTEQYRVFFDKKYIQPGRRGSAQKRPLANNEKRLTVYENTDIFRLPRLTVNSVPLVMQVNWSQRDETRMHMRLLHPESRHLTPSPSTVCPYVSVLLTIRLAL